MRFIHECALALLLIPGPLMADEKPATIQDSPKPKLSELPQSSFLLQGIVDDAASEPFACSFGTYVVKLKGKVNGNLAVTLSGRGLLINSRWLHKNVSANPKITYLFPADSGISDGSVISVFCNGSPAKPGEANVTYYVSHRSSKK